MAENPAEARVDARIVYWGAAGVGKQTNLRVVHAKLRPDHRGELRFVPTRLDPTVTYPMLPIELGEVGGIRTRIQIVAVPNDAEQAPTRKQLLDRADGVVFVVDARRERLADNLASFEELRGGLAAYGRPIDRVPLVIQYNKRDLADPYALEELHRKLSMRGVAAFEAVAKDGTAVLQTLTTISKRVIRHLREQAQGAPAGPAPAQAPRAAAPAPARQLPPMPQPPPGVTQLIDQAAFEASRRTVRPPPEPVVSAEDSQPGREPSVAATVAAADALFEPGFEAVTAVRAKSQPELGIEVDATSSDAGLVVEPAGPPLPAPDGLRIPLILRDPSGRRVKLTLSVKLESEEA
jgi:signal recognition particle receptor subunit beta